MKVLKYNHKVLRGKECFISPTFKEHLDIICEHAQENSLLLHITSSIRTSTNVKGAIVTPAKMSNHLVGHAIDCNIIDGKEFYNSKRLKSAFVEHNLSPNIDKFLETMRQCPCTRWGGYFGKIDVVHFDDGLNLKDPKKYKELLNS